VVPQHIYGPTGNMKGGSVVDSITYATKSGIVGSLFLSNAVDKDNALDALMSSTEMWKPLLPSSSDRFEIWEDYMTWIIGFCFPGT